jgi:hypothetical protein
MRRTILPLMSLAQQTQVYRHPSLNIAFEAPENWRQVPRPEDGLIYEVADPDDAVHVVLWSTTTEQGAADYLWKMADMKGLIVPDRPTPTRIGGSDAWVLNVPGYERNAPVRETLAVIPHGKSVEWPKENVLFIVMIWCPEEDYEQHKQRMEDILGSVRIVE